MLEIEATNGSSGIPEPSTDPMYDVHIGAEHEITVPDNFADAFDDRNQADSQVSPIDEIDTTAALGRDSPVILGQPSHEDILSSPTHRAPPFEEAATRSRSRSKSLSTSPFRVQELQSNDGDILFNDNNSDSESLCEEFEGHEDSCSHSKDAIITATQTAAADRHNGYFNPKPLQITQSISSITRGCHRRKQKCFDEETQIASQGASKMFLGSRFINVTAEKHRPIDPRTRGSQHPLVLDIVLGKNDRPVYRPGVRSHPQRHGLMYVITKAKKATAAVRALAHADPFGGHPKGDRGTFRPSESDDESRDGEMSEVSESDELDDPEQGRRHDNQALAGTPQFIGSGEWGSPSRNYPWENPSTAQAADSIGPKGSSPENGTKSSRALDFSEAGAGGGVSLTSSSPGGLLELSDLAEFESDLDEEDIDLNELPLQLNGPGAVPRK